MTFPHTWSKTRVMIWVRLFIAYFVLLNLPFWIADRYLDISPRGWFNVEYAAVGVFALFVPRWIAGIGLMVVLIADVMHSSTSFYFFTQHDLLHSIQFALQVPAPRLALYAASILLCTGSLAWIALTIAPQIQSRRIVVAAALLSLAGLASGMDVMEGTNSVLPFRTATSNYNFASAPTLGFLRSASQLAFRSRSAHQPVQSASQEFVFVPKEERAPLPKQISSRIALIKPNLVLVLVESLGRFRDPAKQQLFNAVFEKPSIESRYRITSGFVPFNGPTVPGEFRELCGTSAGIFDYPTADILFRSCLPSRLKSAGYDTIAIHGFTGLMFDRASIYPELGFSHLIFREQLPETKGFHYCEGAFKGICDADIAKFIAVQLNQAGEKRSEFIYWVTLDSHLPVAHSSSHDAVCREFGVDSDICDWFATVRNTVSQIADIAATPGLPPTEFILVGDHAPPFFSNRVRSEFDSQSVPFIHLIPRFPHEGMDFSTRSQQSRRNSSDAHSLSSGAGGHP